jgi:predicted O-methyltransferase YrrM
MLFRIRVRSKAMTTKRAIKGTQAEAVLKEIEIKSLKGFLPIIGPEKGKYLAETVRKSGVEKVLEIGTLVGYSAILIAHNLPQDGMVHTVEIDPHSAELAQVNIYKADLEDKIKIHIGNALNIIPNIDEQFDMAFIDASKEEYFDYLKLIEPKLRKNGIVFADNVKIFADRMGDYLDYVRNSGKYQSRYIDVGFDGVEISTKLF